MTENNELFYLPQEMHEYINYTVVMYNMKSIYSPAHSRCYTGFHLYTTALSWSGVSLSSMLCQLHYQTNYYYNFTIQHIDNTLDAENKNNDR